VAAAPGEKVLLTDERERNRKRFVRIRRGIVGSVVVSVVVVLAVQFLNITPPLPQPSSTISSESGPGEWAMIHRNYGGPSPVPGESAAIAGRVLWTFETSSPIVSTPAVKDGNLYLTTQDNRVVSLNAFTGVVNWEYETVAPVDSSPAVAGDLVFFGVRNKRVIALDAATGLEQWEFVTDGNPTIGSPIVKDGVVYIGSGDGNIYALDALTGTKQWDHLTQDWITNTPALSEDLLVVSSLDGRVTIYDTDTGKRRFSFRGFGQMVVGSPIIVEESIYVPYRNGLVASVDLKEKEVLFASRVYRASLQLWLWGMMGHPGLPKGVNWATRLGATVDETPAADEDKIYVPTQDGSLIALDRLTGNTLWTFISGARGLSTPTIVQNVLLVGDDQGVLHAVDSDSGEEQWALQITGGPISTPVLANGTLYLASKDGTLYAVE
jgi:outer membrane protein assembly factor BamB